MTKPYAATGGTYLRRLQRRGWPNAGLWPKAWPLARMRAYSPTASARARDANRREVCAYVALGPTRGPRPEAWPSARLGAPTRPEPRWPGVDAHIYVCMMPGARPGGREKGPSAPKGAPREGIYRPVSNGPVAEHGPRPVAWPLARMRACSPTASAHARDANRGRACAACLCPSGESRQALLRTRQPRSGRMPSDPVPAGAPERPTAATTCRERYAGKCSARRRPQQGCCTDRACWQTLCRKMQRGNAVHVALGSLCGRPQRRMHWGWYTNMRTR